MANLNSNNFQKPDLGNLKFDDIATFKTETLTVANDNPRKSDYLSVDLSQKGLPKQGIFWVKASAVSSGSESDGDNLKIVKMKMAIIIGIPIRIRKPVITV